MNKNKKNENEKFIQIESESLKKTYEKKWRITKSNKWISKIIIYIYKKEKIIIIIKN